MNKPENPGYRRMLKNTVLLFVIFFLCTTPVFYAVVLSDTVYIACRAVRFMLAIIIGFVFRGKRKKIAFQEEQLSKLTAFHVGLICVSIWLNLENIPHKYYITVSHSIGIYNLEIVPLFLRVLWEQMLSSDLYWSILSCLTITFFRIPHGPHAQLERE